MKFYQLNAQALERELNTDLNTGLSVSQVELRKNECSNANVLPFFSVSKLKSNYFKQLSLIFLASIIYVIFSVFSKDIKYIFSALILSFFAILVWFALYFSFKNINSRISDFNKSGVFSYKVIRDGKECIVKSGEILYGDIVLLNKGDYISFDAYVLECDSLIVDETDVSGNNSASKSVGVITDENISVSSIFNSVFSGSVVVNGNAKVVVTDVGKRVYIEKTNKSKEKSYKAIFKSNDVIRLLVFFCIFICSLFSLIESFIYGKIIFGLCNILIFASFFILDFVKIYNELASALAFIKLSKSNCFLKSLSSIEKINDSQIVLLEQDVIFDDSSEISCFTTGFDGIIDVSKLDRNNFSTFLYFAFGSCSQKTSFNPSLNTYVCKMLKKVNIDFSDIDSLCPVVSHYEKFNSSLEVCGRIYDGENLLIAKGDYIKIFEMCDIDTNQIHKEMFDRVFAISTEILAVAVKNVSVIPDDLSEQSSGFRLVGLIGVRKKISNEALKSISSLENLGKHCVTLYTGNESSAKQTFGADCILISLDSLCNCSKNELFTCDVIYNYRENAQTVIDAYSHRNLNTIVCGHCENKMKNIVVFESSDSPHSHIIESDAVCDPLISSIYNIVSEAKNVQSLVKRCVFNLLMFFSLNIICGVVSSLFFKNVNILSPLTTCLVLFGLIYCSLISLFSPTDINFSNRKTNLKLNSKELFFNILIPIVFFSLLLFAFGKTPACAGILAASFAAYLPSLDKSSIKTDILAFIPYVIFAIIFISPISELFSIQAFSYIYALLALAFGVVIKLVVNKICGSAKN